MTSPTIIFHHPLPVDHDPKVGSTSRVAQILAGFRAAGFEVETVVGHSAERLPAMRRLQAEIAAGRRFAFAYAESSTAPTCLNDPDHWPRHPLADWRFFRSLRLAGIPVGLFYRDVHWRFPFYKASVPLPKRLAAALFYRYDLWWYRRTLDVLFLPSVPMRAWVPRWERAGTVIGLPPGGACDPLPVHPRQRPLELFYVGSVSRPLYDIDELVTAVKATSSVHLTVSCPPTEAGIAERWISDRITVVHEHGDALRRRYEACDLACLYYRPETYREFAMPVKLFEAVGFGRPLIANPGTTAAAFIERERVGWVVAPGALGGVLQRLAGHRGEVDEMQQSVRAVQHQHSWERRADFVAQTLMSIHGSGVATPS